MVLVKTSIALSSSLIYKPQANFTACKDKKTIREMEKINVFKNNLQLHCSEIPPFFFNGGMFVRKLKNAAKSVRKTPFLKVLKTIKILYFRCF